MTENTTLLRDIHLLTIDALLSDLIEGKAIAFEDGQKAIIMADDCRAVLDWYRQNRRRWSSNLSVDDTNSIIDSIGTTLPIIKAVYAEVPVKPVKN